uniref:Uncharacterized protein n=1 Tax=Populus davidiana TaxID=266767 RepID=A0A6M2EVV0_9ROSI
MDFPLQSQDITGMTVKSQKLATCKRTPILQPPTPAHPIPFHHTALTYYTSAFKNYACTGYFLGLPLFLGPGILTGVAAAPLPLTPSPRRPPPLLFLSSTFATT